MTAEELEEGIPAKLMYTQTGDTFLRFLKKILDCGRSGRFIPDPTFLLPESLIRTVSIRDFYQRI